MKFEIHPHVGAGPFVFGMKRAEISSLVGLSGLRPPEQNIERRRDYYSDALFFLEYDEHELLCSIEFADWSEVLFLGWNLFDMSFSKALSFLKENGHEAVVDGDGITSYSAGIAIWSPLSGDDIDAEIESVLIFRPGYYDAL